MSSQEVIDNSLDKSITRWQWGIGIYVLLNIAIYFGWFKIVNKFELALNAEVWGQAGDFFGGILNPVVALAAFFWLTKGVRLQKEELADTRAALDAARVAQEQQAANSGVSLRLEALTSLINSNAAEINFRITEMQFLASQLGSKSYAISMHGKFLNQNEVAKTVNNLAVSVKNLDQARKTYQGELESILESTKADLTPKTS